MSMREFEFEARKHKPTPVRGRDLAAAWLAAAAVVASLLLLPAPHGAGDPLRDPALAAAATRGDCIVPNGIESCATRDGAGERC